MHRIKTEESSQWEKRFKEAYRCLKNLKHEIAEKKLIVVLDIYLQKKNADLEISKLLVKIAHVNKINSVYQAEVENLYKIVLKASEVVQENFLLLRSTGELDSEMLDKLQILGKLLQGQRSVKFAFVPVDASAGLNPDPTEITPLQNMMNLSDWSEADDATLSPLSSKKRNNDDDKEEMKTTDSKRAKHSTETGEYSFLRPKAVKSINFDQVTSMSKNASGMGALNVTFDLAGAEASKILEERSNNESSTSSSSTSILKCRQQIVHLVLNC